MMLTKRSCVRSKKVMMETKMRFTNDPLIRILLTNDSRSVVRKDYYEQYKYNQNIGMTNVHTDRGRLFALVDWSIDGLDALISPDVENFVESYELTNQKIALRAPGIYSLMRDGETCARARVVDHPFERCGTTSSVLVTGKKREDVVELYQLVLSGTVRPDEESRTFDQIEGALGELERLRREVPALMQQIEERDALIASLRETTTIN